MEADLQQLTRILQLALYSPYQGERTKATTLLLARLEKASLTLGDLDSSFLVPDAEHLFRQRAGMPYDFEVSLKSREEALLYSGLLQRSASVSVHWLESHRLQCRASQADKQTADGLFEQLLPSLQRQLAAAQQQAMKEYQTRRQVLFDQAVTQELQKFRP